MKPLCATRQTRDWPTLPSAPAVTAFPTHTAGGATTTVNPLVPSDSGRLEPSSPSSRALGVAADAPPEALRTSSLNDAAANASFCDNSISTSKYSLLSFVPHSLFEQFRRVANVYFLFVVVLMLIGTYLPLIFQTPLSPYSTLVPLVVVLTLTSAKEGAEDWKRHASDKAVNSRPCSIVSSCGEATTTPWRNVHVGSVLLIRNREEVPADIVVLATSEDKDVCFVETSNIDGETNLKLKEASAPIATIVHSRGGGKGLGSSRGAITEVDALRAAATLRGDAVYDAPNDRIHSFTGKMRMSATAEDNAASERARAEMTPTSVAVSVPGEYVPLGARNMVLRGCTVRNTKWLLGLVVYTGRDTKVMKKAGGARSKMSAVEGTMNTCIRYIFLAQVILCSVTTLASGLWEESKAGQFPYLRLASVALWVPEWVGNWFTFLLLFNNFIPISLYITCEMVNAIQALLISSDEDMYDVESDTPTRARTSNLNQDLGQLQYIFSDKTGTLTRNVMEFRQASVCGRVFGTFVMDEPPVLSPQPGSPRDAESGTAVGTIVGSNPLATRASVNASLKKSTTIKAPTPRSLDDRALLSLLRESSRDPSSYTTFKGNAITSDGQRVLVPLPGGGSASYTTQEIAYLEAFFFTLAVCHTVVPEADPDGGPMLYQAESPDEAALTQAARDVGFEFTSRTLDRITVDRVSARGRASHTFTVHGIHEFNSTRKRMGMVVTDPAGTNLLLVKGADNIMAERSTTPSGTPSAKVLDEHLTRFAETGLRTLVIAQRVLTDAEFASWRKEFKAAGLLLSGREEALADVAEKYETGLHIVGASAIEDRLQDDVPGTIRDMRYAGIKTWVLTGDKLETAINIGFACRLLDANMELIKVVSEDVVELREQLRDLEVRFGPIATAPPTFSERIRALFCGSGDAAVGSSAPPAATALPRISSASPTAIIFTGPSLLHVLGDKDLERAFLAVGTRCVSVVACRVSPAQKAQIVKLVRFGVYPQPLTLAIGDGANDVGMIQRADVGVGISGKEGLQAANSADFSIAQFRFLRRLLLVHGRWDYRRMSKVVLYSFYKNVVITLTLFCFNALASFSGTSLYESLVYSSFNFVLGLPIIVVGVCDRDVSDKTVLANPKLYDVGRTYGDLNVKRMLLWGLCAISHSMLVFWLPYGAIAVFDTGLDPVNGWSTGLSVAGFTGFLTLIWGMQLVLCYTALTWNKYHVALLIASQAGFYVFVAVYSNIFAAPDFWAVFQVSLGFPAHWLTIALVLGTLLLIIVTAELLRLDFLYTDLDVQREKCVLSSTAADTASNVMASPSRATGGANATGAYDSDEGLNGSATPLAPASVAVAAPPTSPVVPITPVQTRLHAPRRTTSAGGEERGVRSPAA